jgi:hypothetical protein
MIKNDTFFRIERLVNLTSNMDLAAGYSEALEIDPTHVVFEVPERSCAKGQLVELEGLISMNHKEFSFDCTGKITEVKPIGNHKMKAFIELHSFDRDVWSRFVNVMKERQNSVDLLFKKIKGE